jgi:hemolysin III
MAEVSKLVREKSDSEEFANMATHAAGVVLSLAALFLLARASLLKGDTASTLAHIAFGLTLVLLYLASAAYHTVRTPKLRHRFKVLDHCAIYFLIAGTYTPFMVTHLPGSLGASMLATIWGLAVLGVCFKCFFVYRFKVVSTGVYLAMGWLVVFVMGPLVKALPSDSMAWLVAGGVSYSVGVPFYLWDRLRFNHAVWHLFVLGGSVCHVVSVLLSSR